MTAYHGAYMVAWLAFFAVVAGKLRDFAFQPRCMKCGGKLAHKKDCAWRRR